VRLAAGLAAGRLADRLEAPRAVLAGCSILAALIALFYLPAHGQLPLLMVGVLQAAALAPLAPLADSLALAAAGPAPRVGFAGRYLDYGWMRGAGSAAFILGAVLSGEAVGHAGIAVVIWLNALLLAAAALCATRVPLLLPPRLLGVTGAPGGIGALLHLPMFRRSMFVAALVIGSHALHDSFAVIRWLATGIAPGTAGLLWSEAVAAEVVVFLFLGRPLLDRLGIARAAALAAVSGVVRWAVMAQTAWVPAMMMIQPLHGLTFALLHLACVRLLSEIVPPRTAATALALYGTVGIAAATALVTLASGPLYARLGAQGFWLMGALCAAALPLALSLREPSDAPPAGAGAGHHTCDRDPNSGTRSDLISK
jgi:PPP family 3-phenylpropionic acid transporter